MANFCMSCGVPVEPSAKFCELCGQELEQERPETLQAISPEVRPIDYAVEQQQQPQPLYPQQPYAQAMAKKKSRLPILLGIVGGVVVLIIVTVVLILRGASGSLNNMAKANFYEIGNDEVASIKLALGEQRTITGVSTSTKKGALMKEITFAADGSDPYEDMIAYVNYLREDDFLFVTDVDFNGEEGEVTLGRDSVDKGYSILVELEYDDTGYVITLIRQKGEVTAYNLPDTDVLPVTDPEPKPDPDSDSEPSPDPGPGSKADPNPSPNPGKNPGANPGSSPAVAAQSAIDIFDNGCFHMVATFDVEGQGKIEMETYRNGDKAALVTKMGGTTSKTVIKDGTAYYIIDDVKTVYSNTDGVEEMIPEYGSATMSYIGEGTGEFNGKTYAYSEFAEKDGGRSYYFMEDGALKGISVVMNGNSIFEQTILTLDTNVPDDVFSWPSNYEVIDSSS